MFQFSSLWKKTVIGKNVLLDAKVALPTLKSRVIENTFQFPCWNFVLSHNYQEWTLFDGCGCVVQIDGGPFQALLILD